jgi:tetratricopeptide (TPR) repeat protein
MLTGPTLELVGMAAELGSEFSFGILQAVLPDLEGGLLAALDAAMASGLLVEAGGGYAFAHPLFRMAVRGSSGSARRASAHLDIARAIAGCREDDPPERLAAAAAACVDLSTAADHALSAVDLGAPTALPIAVALGFAAAARAARMFDPATASVLERALAAWQRLPPELAAGFDACAANTSLANLRLHAGDEDRATQSFRDAIATARTPHELANAYGDYVWLPYRHGDFEGALAILEEGLARLPVEAAAARATLDRYVGWMLGRLRRLDEAIAHLEDAVRVLEGAGDRRNAMNALDQLGIMLELVHRSDEAIARLERSLAIALDLHDLRGESVRIHLGTALTRSGRPGRARAHIERGLEVARQMGDRYLEAVAAWAAAEMEEALGNDDAAVVMRHRELGLLASIGGNPHNEALAHAHLAHLARRRGDNATFDAEAAAARHLAAASPNPGYTSRIEEAISTTNWSDLETG